MRRPAKAGQLLTRETSAGAAARCVGSLILRKVQTAPHCLKNKGGQRRWSAQAHAGRALPNAGGNRAIAVVVLWDCGGCRSRRAALGPRSKDRGSSRLARRPRGVRAQRVKRRRKPDRGGESRQHASSETGGGLLVIPRAGAKASVRQGEGATRTTEGVLSDETRQSLTRWRGLPKGTCRTAAARSEGDRGPFTQVFGTRSAESR